MFSVHTTPAIPIFQSYLIPSLPFRRRKSSADTQASSTFSGRHASVSTTATSPPGSLDGASPGNIYRHGKDLEYAFSPSDRGEYLAGHTSTMSCARCHAHLALTSQIVSKGFTGRHGRAYLVSPAVTPFSPNEAHHRRSSLSFSKTSVVGRFTPSSPSTSARPVYTDPFASAAAAGHSDANSSDSSSSPVDARQAARSSSTAKTPSASTQRRRSCTIADPKTLPNTHTHRPSPRRLVTGMHTVADITCTVCGSNLGWKYVAAEEDAQRYKVGKFILEAKRVSVGVDWESLSPAGSGSGEEGEEGHELDEMFGVAASEDHSMADEITFDSQDEDECEDLFAGVWSPALARRRRRLRQGGAA